ncbi:MAG: hypothetical protein ACREX8_18290, partial [Gammaproteobacteria bacterium]
FPPGWVRIHQQPQISRLYRMVVTVSPSEVLDDVPERLGLRYPDRSPALAEPPDDCVQLGRRAGWHPNLQVTGILISYLA